MKIGTKCIHAGEKHDPSGAHAHPIFMTSSFTFENWEEAKKKFNPENPSEGYVYSRMSNPNLKNFEEKIKALYEAEDALVFSSGMAAIDTTMRTLLEPNDHVVCSRTLYGCTHQLFSEAHHLPKFEIKFDFVDSRRAANIFYAIRSNTKVVYLEILSNPTLELTDLKNIIKKVKTTDPTDELYVIVDNTFLGPYNFNPIAFGADLVIDSATKYLSGHGDIVLGSVAGRKDLIEKIAKWRAHAGAVPNPFQCWLAARGLKTYTLRMEAHNENALLLAKFLEDHPMIEKVIYPGLSSYMQRELAKEIMPNGFSGMISFELKGGIEVTELFLEEINKEKIISFAVSLGSVDTMIQHPATMTHAGVPKKDRLERGITDKLIRISVGIENYEDIVTAFSRALDATVEKFAK